MKRWVVTAISSWMLLAVLAGPASAAIVKNGNFETGNLSGWKQRHNPGGIWKVYAAGDSTCGSLGPLTVIDGTYSAVTDQGASSRQVIFQDIQLPDARRITLELRVAYMSSIPILAPGTLSISQPNHQFRVDVLRESTSAFTMRSRSILATALATQNGDPAVITPEFKKANLSKFRGQKVRLRIAVAATSSCLTAIVDSVKIKAP